MSQQDNNTNNSSGGFWTALMAFMRAMLRLLVVVVILMGIVALVYWAIPYLYQTFVVPVEENTIAVRVLETRQDYTEEYASQRFSDIARRLDGLELESATNNEVINDLQNSLDNAREDLEGHQSQLDDLAYVHEMLDVQSETMDELDSQIERLSRVVETQRLALDDLITSPDAADDDPLKSIEQQMVLLRVMDNLTQARLSLLEEDTTQTAQFVIAARGSLMSLQSDVQEFQADWLIRTIMKVEETLFSLTAEPEQTAILLREAWILVADGLPQTEEDAIRMQTGVDEQDDEMGMEEVTPPPITTEPSPGQEDTPTPTPTPASLVETSTPTPIPTEDE